MRPYLVDPNETFRRCGQDIKVNLIFSKLFGQKIHLFKKNKPCAHPLKTLARAFYNDLFHTVPGQRKVALNAVDVISWKNASRKKSSNRETKYATTTLMS